MENEDRDIYLLSYEQKDDCWDTHYDELQESEIAHALVLKQRDARHSSYTRNVKLLICKACNLPDRFKKEAEDFIEQLRIRDEHTAKTYAENQKRAIEEKDRKEKELYLSLKEKYENKQSN
jgi:hypothetical protein